MIEVVFWKVFTAVMFGNFLTALWLYGFYRIHKADELEDYDGTKWTDYAFVLVPMLFTATGLYLMHF